MTPSSKSRTNRRSAAYLIATAALAGLLGKGLGPNAGWAVLVGGLLVQLGFHLRHVARLERWTRHPVDTERLEGRGVWDGIFARLYRHEKHLLATIARRETEVAEFSTAIQALTDGIILLDADNRITWCNVTAEAQFGISARADAGQHLVNLVRQPEFVDYLNAGDFARPLLLRSDLGADRVLSIHLLAYGSGNQLMQVKDVTQTEQLDRMRRDFVANVSHELRTPLTVLAGFVETLQELDLDAAQRQRYLGLMGEQSTRMQNIVRDLLTLSSLESAPPPEDEPIDMARLLDKLLRDAKALSAGRHGIVLDVAGGDLRGAEDEIISACGNLVSNAVRYTPEGGSIVIRWAADKHGGEFSVTDSGIGIDAKHLRRLTERFYRVDRSRSRDTGGTGLGLAIVKHALNRHQATLDITSEPGKGSCFKARFPAARIVAA